MFGSMMGDGFDDLLGGHMRRMNSMMNSFFPQPFGNDMLSIGDVGGRSRSMGLLPFEGSANDMMSPFGFPNMNQIMRNMNQMSNNPHCHSFSSSSVMTMTTGPDGRPQVYQETSSTKTAPGGVRETKKSVCDSRTGMKKLAIGHHIGDKGHIKEKEKNVYSGQVEENDEYINLDEEEEAEFNREWQQKTRQYASPSVNSAIGYQQSPNYGNYNQQYLALPPSSSVENDSKDISKQKKKSQRSKPYSKRKEKKNQE